MIKYIAIDITVSKLKSQNYVVNEGLIFVLAVILNTNRNDLYAKRFNV